MIIRESTKAIVTKQVVKNPDAFTASRNSVKSEAMSATPGMLIKPSTDAQEETKEGTPTPLVPENQPSPIVTELQELVTPQPVQMQEIDRLSPLTADEFAAISNGLGIHRVPAITSGYPVKKSSVKVINCIAKFEITSEGFRMTEAQPYCYGSPTILFGHGLRST